MRYPDLPDVPIVRVAQDDLTHRMSEYVVLHCLMALRDQRRYDAQQRERLWRDDRSPAGRPRRAGRHARLRRARPGRGRASSRSWASTWRAGAARRKPSRGCRVYAGADELDAFLARTDILVSPAAADAGDARHPQPRPVRASSPATARLGGPVLINAGRGGLQVEADILACLDDGTLKAATLDVFETEPLPQDSPLWAHPARHRHAAQRRRRASPTRPPATSRTRSADSRRARRCRTSSTGGGDIDPLSFRGAAGEPGTHKQTPGRAATPVARLLDRQRLWGPGGTARPRNDRRPSRSAA